MESKGMARVDFHCMWECFFFCSDGRTTTRVHACVFHLYEWNYVKRHGCLADAVTLHVTMRCYSTQAVCGHPQTSSLHLLLTCSAHYTTVVIITNTTSISVAQRGTHKHKGVAYRNTIAVVLFAPPAETHHHPQLAVVAVQVLVVHPRPLHPRLPPHRHHCHCCFQILLHRPCHWRLLVHLGT